VYVCFVRFGSQWEGVRDSWSEARIRVTLEEPERIDRAAQLLGPLQPYRAGAGVLTFRAVGHSEAVGRLLGRLDDERIHGTLELVSSDPIHVPAPPAPELSLRQSWDAAVANVPADWSDLLAEVELSSSDWLDRAAVAMVPLNPRRDGDRVAFRFRAARRFGYGASPQMVARCLARCDERGMHGKVSVLRVLSDTHPASTQGPVWLLDGRTV
jgi:hypothetical protein